MYLNPDTFSGIGVSLQIVFAAIAGGMYAMLGPTVGALFTIAPTDLICTRSNTSRRKSLNAQSMSRTFTPNTILTKTFHARALTNR